jgi:hypothetical protein
MIAELDQICTNLGHQIEAEEMSVRISDPAHVAYPTYAKAARERRAKIERSVDALRIEFDRLRSEANDLAMSNLLPSFRRQNRDLALTS